MRVIAGRCPFNNCRTLKCQLATASNFERSGLIRLNCCSLGLGQPYVDLDWLINWLKICPIIFIACLNYCKSWGAWAALCGPWLQWSNFPQLPPNPSLPIPNYILSRPPANIQPLHGKRLSRFYFYSIQRRLPEFHPIPLSESFHSVRLRRPPYKMLKCE